MQSRRLRLGDVVDDYCPRERRLSNHVIVAMIDDTIKQTRCSTCDFEHPYKEGKLPARRSKKDQTPSLYKQVLDNVTEGTVLADAPSASNASSTPPPRGVLRPNGTSANEADASEPADQGPPRDAEPAVMHAAPNADRRSADRTGADQNGTDQRDNEEREPADEGPVHRTLIRATLPRQEGEVPARPIPSFTVREAATAPKFRRFRPKRAGAHPFGDGFGNQGGGFKNPQFAQPGRGHGQKPGGHNRGNPQQPRAAGAPGGGGGRRNNQARRGNKGPR